MKYLNYFESSESEIFLIKDILIELKHEYSNVAGNIYPHDDGEIEIHINCDELILNGIKNRLDYIKNKNNFINLVVDVCYRIEDALNRKVGVLNLYDFDDNDDIIKIFILNK